MTDRFRVLFGQLKRLLALLFGPLKKDPNPTKFDLAIPDSHNATVEGDTGWATRPPAWLECPRCGSDIYQRDAREKIDCPRCVAEFPPSEFADLTLERLQCPVCGNAMEHGIRHPNAFDVPEWATCRRCRYHWEFGHLF